MKIETSTIEVTIQGIKHCRYTVKQGDRIIALHRVQRTRKDGTQHWAILSPHHYSAEIARIESAIKRQETEA